MYSVLTLEIRILIVHYGAKNIQITNIGFELSLHLNQYMYD
jgi:hypothetical protein